MAEVQRRQERKAFRSLSRTLRSVDMTQGQSTPYPDLVASLDNLLRVIEAEEEQQVVDKVCQPAAIVKTEEDGDSQPSESGLLISNVLGAVSTSLDKIMDDVKPLITGVPEEFSSAELSPLVGIPVADHTGQCGLGRVSDVNLTPGWEKEPDTSLKIDDITGGVLTPAGNAALEIKQYCVPTRLRSRKSSVVKKIPREKAKYSRGLLANSGIAPEKKETKPSEAVKDSVDAGRGDQNSGVSSAPAPQDTEKRTSGPKRKRPIVEYFILADNSKVGDKSVKGTGEKSIIKSPENKATVIVGINKRKSLTRTDQEARSAKKPKLVEEEEKLTVKEEQLTVKEEERLTVEEGNLTGKETVRDRTKVRSARRISEPKVDSKASKKPASKNESKAAKKFETKDESKPGKKAGGGKSGFQDQKLLHVPDFNPYTKKAKSFRRPRGREKDIPTGEEAFQAEVEYNRKVTLLGRIHIMFRGFCQLLCRSDLDMNPSFFLF
jgi:hypothetical protein